MIRHAGFLANNFHIRRFRRTSYYVIHGHEYRGQLAQFGEVVLGKYPVEHNERSKALPGWDKSIWVGINEHDNSHIVLNLDGYQIVRSISRLVTNKQWDGDFLMRVAGLPWARTEGGRNSPSNCF